MTQTESLQYTQSILEVDGSPEIHLRAASYSDVDELYDAVINDPRMEEYGAWRKSLTTYLEVKDHNNTMVNSQGVFEYRIIPGRNPQEQSGPLVGAVMLHGHNPDKHTSEFGYWLARGAEGNGYAYRSASRLLEYGKEELGLVNVIARIAKGNERSERLAIRLGCTLTDRFDPRIVSYKGGRRGLIMREWTKDL
ncbi:MAG: GNAT family N-acetyltransferase [Candidatus Saccharimonadales bacterium]